MSLDNIITDPENWMSMSDNILKSAIKYYEQVDTVIIGSKTYHKLADYWTKAEQISDSEVERQVAKKINKINKFVLPRSNLEIVWENSKLLNFSNIKSLSESLDHLKQQKVKDISVESGAGLWNMFLENSLFDELLVFIHPVIVGKGERLFMNFNLKEELTLKSNYIFENGVVELKYSKKMSNHK